MYPKILPILTVLLFLFLPLRAEAKGPISAASAIHYVGTQQTVCGTVANSKYAKSSRGKPTFLNLDQPYPNHIFTILIWGENRGKFSTPPEILYDGKSVCVSGTISTYKGKAEIVVVEPSQITNK